MQYLLNGGGHEVRSLQSLEITDFLHQAGVKNLVIIAFAMAETHWQQVWEQPEQMITLSGINITSLTLTNYTAALATARLSAADAIFMPGGIPAVLMERLVDTGCADLLQGSIDKQQLKVVGGASAGAMVLGKMYGSNHKPGLNIVDNHIIDVHFSNRGRMSRLQAVIDANHELTGIGIDEDTTLLLNDDWRPQQIFGDGTTTYYRYNETMKTYDKNTTFTTRNSDPASQT